MVVRYNRDNTAASNYIRGRESTSMKRNEPDIEKVGFTSSEQNAASSSGDAWLDVPRTT